MKTLPYFKWFSADAEGDDFYISLTDAEGWTFHRCLNRAWMNDGIPADLDELGAILHKPRAYMDKVWPKLSRRWVQSPRDPEKLVNPRQEEERSVAIAKSENNKRVGDANGSRTRRERVTNDPQRTYVSVSDSASDSSSQFLKESARQIQKVVALPGFDFEAWFKERWGLHPIPGKPQIAQQYAMEKINQTGGFTAAQFNENHAAWCRAWIGQTSGIPNLETFIRDDWWRKSPPVSSPSAPAARKSTRELVLESMRQAK